MLAVVPARGGSKGLPDKNILPLAGVPLIAHSILFAKMCPQIARCIVSTDSERIAEVARQHGGEVPFLRPPELAREETTSLPVFQHALKEMEKIAGHRFESLLALQPTNPVRTSECLTRAIAILEEDAAAQGVVSVAELSFNPRYVCVDEQEGYMHFVFAETYQRRQDAPPTFRITGSMYLWRRDFLLSTAAPLAPEAHIRMVHEQGPIIDIDAAADMQVAAALIREGIVQMPWLPAATGNK